MGNETPPNGDDTINTGSAQDEGVDTPPVTSPPSENSFEVDVSNVQKPAEQTIQHEILKDDAKFRREFAMSMFALVVVIIIIALVGHIIAGMVALQNPSHEFPKALLTAVEDIFPIAFSGVMGVFGTVVGFYYAAGDKN